MAFFFNDTATTEIYTLSLHDALPILIASDLVRAVTFAALPFVGSAAAVVALAGVVGLATGFFRPAAYAGLPNLVEDRKSTRLNSSHANISYAVFCLKKQSQFVHALAR